MFQSTTIVGRAGGDPEVRNTNSGQSVANLSVATTYRRKGPDGNQIEETEWHRCVLFGRTAEIAAEYVNKGDLVLLVGRLQTREYEKDGIKRFSTELVANDLKLFPRAMKAGAAVEPAAPAGVASFDEDLLPF